MNGSLVATIIGIAAACLTTGAWMPQVVQTCRTRSAEDFSWGYLALFATGVALWAVYGMMRRDAAVIGANVVTFVLVVVVAAIKLKDES